MTADDKMYTFIEESIPLDLLDVEADENLDALIEAFAEALSIAEDNIEVLREQADLETASGEALDRMAAARDLRRRTDESDESLRERIRVKRLQTTSDTSHEAFANLCERIFDADVDLFTIEPSAEDEPRIIIRTDASVVENSPFDTDGLNDRLEESLPAGHGSEIQTVGTFRLDGPDYTPPDGSGLNEGTLGGSIQ